MFKNKIYISILLVLFVHSFAFAEENVLKMSVNKEVMIESLRQEALKDIELIKNLDQYPSRDPDYVENKIARIQHKNLIKNRSITYFRYGGYAIRILNNTIFNVNFAYTKQGKLEAIIFDSYPIKVMSLNEYFKYSENNTLSPTKQYQYSYPDGNLESISIVINNSDIYAFNPKGELKRYWKDKKCYDPDGNLINEQSFKPFTEE